MASPWIYAARRLALAIPLLLGMSVLVFGLMRFVPGDPAVVVLGYKATPEGVRALREAFHLDEPLPAQYARCLAGRRGAALRRLRPDRRESPRESAAPRVARADAGAEPRRRAGTAEPRGGARRRAARVRAVCPSQGSGRACRPLPPRPAQRRDSDRDGARATDRLHAGRRDRRGDDLHAAGPTRGGAVRP